MAKQGILFLVHGEVTDPEIDIFDREAAFIGRVMKPVLAQVPNLKVVFEHITTAEAARLVLEAGDNVAASVTPQHLLLNRNDLLVGGVRPHHFCLPVLKRETHRQALVAAVTGEKAHKFFLHRLRAARQIRQRKRLRLRRYVQRDDRYRALRRSV